MNTSVFAIVDVDVVVADAHASMVNSVISDVYVNVVGVVSGVYVWCVGCVGVGAVNVVIANVAVYMCVNVDDEC